MIQLLGGPQLLGLGAASNVESFLLAYPSPSSSAVAEFLKPYSDADRVAMAEQLIARGVDPGTISRALQWLAVSQKVRSNRATIFGILALASAAASAYHGGKRNDGSIGWAAWWFLMGTIFPVFTPIVAAFQGYAKPKKAS